MEHQKIFFSYSRVDGEPFALRLANDLRRHNANVWIDQLSITPGMAWDRAIEQALESSDCVLLIATEKSTSSNNVLNEVSYALDENKKVIPVIFHKCRMPLLLRRLQHIDFSVDYDTAFQRLLQTLGLPTVTNPEEEPKPKKGFERSYIQEQSDTPDQVEMKRSTPASQEKEHEYNAYFPPAYEEEKQRSGKKLVIGGIAVVAIAVISLFLLLGKRDNDNTGTANSDTTNNNRVLAFTDSSKTRDAGKQSTASNTGLDPTTEKKPRNPKPRLPQNDPSRTYRPNTQTDGNNGTLTGPQKEALYILSPAEKAAIDFPRKTNVTWSKVEGATSYTIQIEYGGSADFARAGEFTPFGTYKTQETSYTFQGVGAQVHRFRVIARHGDETLSETRWRYITYTN